MTTRALAGSLAVAVVVMVSTARASDVRVSVAGCPAEDAGLRDALGAALVLEARGWNIDEAAPTVLEVARDGCSDAEWTVRMSDGTGATLHGPTPVDVSSFPPGSRPRAIALVAAEWLLHLPPSDTRGADEVGTTTREAATEAVLSSSPSDAPPVVGAAGAPSATVPPTTETASRTGGGAAALEAPAPPPERLPVIFRGLVLAGVRHLIDMPATFGGLDGAFEVSGRGSLTLAGQIGGGVEAGLHWDRPAVLLRAHAAALGILVREGGFELALGFRGTLLYVVYYDLGRVAAQLYDLLHGALGGVVRGSLELVPGVALAVEIELGAAVASPVYVYDDPRATPPGSEQVDLFGGFAFGARAGLVFE